MQLYYCHTCSKLIAPALIDSGQVKVEDEKPVFCCACHPPSSGSVRSMRSTPADGLQRNIRNMPAPVRGSPSRGNRTAPPAAQSGTRIRAQSDRASNRQNTPMLIVGLVLGGLVILGMVVVALSGSKPANAPVKKTEAVKVADEVKKEEPSDRDFRGPGFLTPGTTPSDTAPKSVRGRYVRIDLKGDKRVLSLAEVEVFSGDKNVALKGKATQAGLESGGTPERAIDGKTDGAFPHGSVTHTDEMRDPWWEVDLGDEYDIRKIVVWNRTDEKGKYLSRLKDFTTVVLDAKRTSVWRREKAPAPNPYYMLFPK